MMLGQRVVWLVPGKTGRVTGVNKLKRTVDLTFEEDGSTRGDVPIAEVVSVTQGAVEPPTTRGRKPKPPGIDSQERFGRPSLGE